MLWLSCSFRVFALSHCLVQGNSDNTKSFVALALIGLIPEILFLPSAFCNVDISFYMLQQVWRGEKSMTRSKNKCLALYGILLFSVQSAVHGLCICIQDLYISCSCNNATLLEH